MAHDVALQCGWCGEVINHSCDELSELVRVGHVCLTSERLTKIKELLEQEPVCESSPAIMRSGFRDVIPILHNDRVAILQFLGWSINLHADGTWHWEATDGG